MNTPDENVRGRSHLTELSKVDFGEYLDKICALNNASLPDPEAAG